MDADDTIASGELCDAIREALVLADKEENFLVGAILADAMAKAHCDDVPAGRG